MKLLRYILCLITFSTALYIDYSLRKSSILILFLGLISYIALILSTAILIGTNITENE